MKRLKSLLALLFFALPLIAGGNCRDWTAFMEPKDFIWKELSADPPVPKRHWHRKDGYYAGALMGNGLLGTNLYKLRDSIYRLNVGRSDVIEARESFDLCGSARLPIGYFTLTTVGRVEKESLRLSIYDAQTRGIFTTDKGEISFKTYVHAERDIIEFESDAGGDELRYKWDFIAQEAKSPQEVMRPGSCPEDYLNSEGKANPEAMKMRVRDVDYLIQPLARDSSFSEIARYYVVAWKEQRSGTHRRIAATIVQEEKLENALASAEKTLLQAFGLSEETLEKTHTAWWHEFYEKAAFLTFPDREIETFYWRQYYKFASTARPRKPVVDLQGVWATYDTIWPGLWMNLNIQLTYCWLVKANLGEFQQPLWDALYENRENLRRNVSDNPGQENWKDCMVLPRICSYNMHNRLRPEWAQSNQYEVGNLTWTLFYYYLMCKAYSDDEQMTQRLFPLLKAAVNMFFRIRKVDEHGRYCLPDTASPEYRGSEGPSGPNTNYDLANLYQGLSMLIDIDTTYRLQDPKLPEWRDFKDKLRPFCIDPESGFKISETLAFEDSTHRHFSHLFMIYPYHIVEWDDPYYGPVMERSVARWNGDVGYSLIGKAEMFESAGRGEEALGLMKRFLGKWVRPNTLYNEFGPVIETPLFAMSAFEDMYMQDWGDCIRVFFGCPASWKEACFENMRASGAFLVSAERREGKTKSVRVYSEKGGLCRLQPEPSSLEIIEWDMLPGETRIWKP